MQHTTNVDNIPKISRNLWFFAIFSLLSSSQSSSLIFFVHILMSVYSKLGRFFLSWLFLFRCCRALKQQQTSIVNGVNTPKTINVFGLYIPLKRGIHWVSECMCMCLCAMKQIDGTRKRVESILRFFLCIFVYKFSRSSYFQTFISCQHRWLLLAAVAADAFSFWLDFFAIADVCGIYK